MNQQNPQPEKQKEKPRFNHWQYKFLKLCSEKGDEGIKRWNKWRNKHPCRRIFLEGADLEGTFLYYIFIEDINPFIGVNLERASLIGANLKNAYLWNANLKDAILARANLEDSILVGAYLEGACLNSSNMKDSDFGNAIVDSRTALMECEVNRNTDFEGVALDNVQIDTATKQLLEYNIRRNNWEDWYNEHPFLKFLVKAFWWMSDYGISTKRIIVTFFGLTFVFALLYKLFPDFVMVYGTVGDIRGFWHALYFSVVTMTTLGFGDIAANPDSWAGQTLLMLQVILGYVLLGALVTRFAVLFTAGGPAGKFADEKSIWKRIADKIRLKSKKENKSLED